MQEICQDAGWLCYNYSFWIDDFWLFGKLQMVIANSIKKALFQPKCMAWADRNGHRCILDLICSHGYNDHVM